MNSLSCSIFTSVWTLQFPGCGTRGLRKPNTQGNWGKVRRSKGQIYCSLGLLKKQEVSCLDWCTGTILYRHKANGSIDGVTATSTVGPKIGDRPPLRDQELNIYFFYVYYPLQVSSAWSGLECCHQKKNHRFHWTSHFVTALTPHHHCVASVITFNNKIFPWTVCSHSHLFKSLKSLTTGHCLTIASHFPHDQNSCRHDNHLRPLSWWINHSVIGKY